MKEIRNHRRQDVIFNIIGSIIVLLLSSLIIGCVSYARSDTIQEQKIIIIEKDVIKLQKELNINEDIDNKLKNDLTKIESNQAHIIKQLDRILFKIYPGAL
jgi:hypothetical protein